MHAPFASSLTGSRPATSLVGASFVAVSLLTAAAAAQVPQGSYVVSTFHSGTRTPGGLFLVEPRVASAPVAVQGLGNDLTGVGTGTMAAGANCVALRRDGMLVVGELGQAGTAIDLHLITLAGANAVLDVTIPVGTVASGTLGGGGIQGIAFLPNGDDVLIALIGLSLAPPLQGAGLAIVSTTARTVKPLVTSLPPGGGFNACCVDPMGLFAYVSYIPTAGRPNSEIHAVALPAGGNTRLVGAFASIAAMAMDRFGRIIVTQAGFGTPTLDSIDPATGAGTMITTLGTNPNAMDLERVTDEIVVVLNGFGPAGAEVSHTTRAGVSTPLSNALTGVPSGVAVAHDPWTYGSGTAGNAAYRWQVEPGPGGLPRVGNGSFGVQLLTSAATIAPGALLASTGRAAVPVGGLTLLLDSARLVQVGPVPLSGSVPLPLAPGPALLGAHVFLQSVHLDAGGPLGLAASNGLEVTVLQ